MYIGRYYGFIQTIRWKIEYLILFAVWSTIPVLLYTFAGLKWLVLPWVPIALIGTAVAFYLGFKNNSSYDRLWEARKVWGAIVNNSRSWGLQVLSYVGPGETTPEIHSIRTRLIYRHIAWLTALRFQMRQPRSWEHHEVRSAKVKAILQTPELHEDLQEELGRYLSEEEVAYVLRKSNPAAHLIRLQGTDLKAIQEQGMIDDFRHMELTRILTGLYDEQGKSERIKNFPFPRQYASVNLFFVVIFILLLPFGMVREFDNMGAHFVWLSIPFSTMVSWVFHSMEVIGDYSENPFEGHYNDVPISSMSRTIEIDLREMLDEQDVPGPRTAVNNTLM